MTVSQPMARTQQLSLFDSTTALRSPDRADELPRTARAIMEVIGLDATIDLVKLFGGDEPRIPAQIDSASRVWDALVEAIGRDAAVKMVEAFGDTQIYVPFCRQALLNLRNREIIQSYDAGEPLDAIRRRYRISRSYLFRVLKKPV
jgi:Mor family transcriptional regulator